MRKNVEYEFVHRAIDKLQHNLPLFQQEREALLTVLENAQGHSIPTKEELEHYHELVGEIHRIDPVRFPTQYNYLLGECKKYEHKYDV